MESCEVKLRKTAFVLVAEMSCSLKVVCMKNSESFWDARLKFRSFSGGSSQRMDFSVSRKNVTMGGGLERLL